MNVVRPLRSLSHVGALALSLCALFACKRTASPAPSASASTALSAPPPSASVDLLTQASEETPFDAGPSVMNDAARVDGDALRKRHAARLASDTSPVTVLKGQSPLALGEAICSAVVPWRPKATPILLKPNLCGFDGLRDPDKTKGDDGFVGRTTDVRFTRGVVRCLKKRGHTRITVAEGCGISHQYWKQVAERSGYERMAREEGVALVAMDDDGVYDVEGEKPGLPLRISGLGKTRVPNLLMPKVLAEHLDHGLFISLPKIKTHRFSVTSMAIKGMQGTVMLSDARPAYKQKYRMHRELGTLLKERKAARKAAKESGETLQRDPVAERRAYVATLRVFAERMMDVLELETPDVVLADGAPAMGGDGFWQLFPSSELVAIGGTNPVMVDRVGAALLGLWNHPRLASELGGHRTSPLIEAAAKRFKLDIDEPKLEGNGAALLASGRPTHFRSMDGFAIYSDDAPAWAPVSLSVQPAPWESEQGPRTSPAPGVTSVPPPSTSASPSPPGAEHEATPSAHASAAAKATAIALGADRIQLDGRGDDAAWRRAKAVEWTTDWAGANTNTRTQARFAWSPDHLYVLFELEGAGLFTDRSRPISVEREALFKEDCVELFLGHDASNPNHYLEIELGPFGHYFDLDVRRGGKTSSAWSSGLEIATTRDAKARRAVIEARFGAKEIRALLRSGARLPMGLYRMEGKSPRQYLAWSPTLTRKPNFHVPDRFGVLVLE